MRLHREILEILLGRIAAGTYAVGALLPEEQRLAEELDVSRGVVRECVRALEERSIVRVGPRPRRDRAASAGLGPARPGGVRAAIETGVR